MDNEVNLVCVGSAASHLDSHCDIGSGSGNSNGSNNLSKSQLKMREQALRKRVSANTSTQSTTYKAPIFGIPVKIEPSDSDRTQKLIKQALGDYDDFKPVIEKMFICPVPPGTPKPKSAVNNQLTTAAPGHNFHHAGGKRKRSRSLEEVDISQLIKESFALPPLLSRILNVDIVKQEHQNYIANSSSVLIKTEPDQNSIPNCDKLLPSSRKPPETLISLPQSSKVASKSATAESTKLPCILEGISVKKEERGSLSPDTAPDSTNNWSLSCFLDPVAPECQQHQGPAPSFPPQSSVKKDDMTVTKRENSQHHKLLMADIDSSFSLAVSATSQDLVGITTTPLKKKQRRNSTNLEPQAAQPSALTDHPNAHQQPLASPRSSQSKSPATARLPKTYRLLARKKTPPTTPPPAPPLADLAPKREFIGEDLPSCQQSSRSANHQGTTTPGVTIAQTSLRGVPTGSLVNPSPTHSAPSCGSSGGSSNSSGSDMEDGEVESIALKNEITERSATITSLPVKIDLALIKKIPILPYHYNNDINYASSCSTTASSLLQSANLLATNTGNSGNSNNNNNVNPNGDGSLIRMGECGVSDSFASSNTANAWAPLLPPPHNPLTRWDLGENRQMPPPPPIDIGAPVERLPAQLSRFQHFSPYQYKPPTLSSSHQSPFSNKDHPCNNNNQLKATEPQPQQQGHHQIQFPPKISWGLPSQLPCVYSATLRFDIPCWRNIGLCPELTTYPCNDIIRIAKNLKRSADREVTRNLKVMMYLDAVLYFFLNGDYMQIKKFDLTGAHKIYHDTMNVCRHISDLVQKGINSNVSNNTVMDQIFVILTQKIQALLYIKMFQCKKEQCLRNQRLLHQEFPKLLNPPPAAFYLGINSGQNYNYAHDGPTSLLNHHSSSPDPSPASSVGSVTNYGDSGVKTKLSDTDPISLNRAIHPTVHQQLTLLEGALISHHLWDLSENGIATLCSPRELSTSSYPRHLISSNPHPDYRDCFTEILTVCRQPLTLNSSVWHLVIYVKFALYYLGYWLNPTYYDPQTTIPSANASAPPPSSAGLKEFHKKGRPPTHKEHKEVAIDGK